MTPQMSKKEIIELIQRRIRDRIDTKNSVAIDKICKQIADGGYNKSTIHLIVANTRSGKTSFQKKMLCGPCRRAGIENCYDRDCDLQDR